MTRRSHVQIGILLAGLSWSLTASADPTKQQCADAINSGQELRLAHKLVEAKARFAICVATSCPAALRDDCGKRLADTVAALPALVFEVKDVAGNDAANVRVTMDDKLLAEKLTGAPIEIDPGEHHFLFEEADGLASKTEKTILVNEGDRDRHLSVVLGSATTETGTTARARSEKPASGPPTAAWLAFGAGGAGLVVGVVFTVLGSTAGSSCPNETCQGNASDVNAEVRTDTVAAGIGYGVAIAGAVAGGVILLTSAPPSSAAVQTGLRVGPAGITLEGSF